MLNKNLALELCTKKLMMIPDNTETLNFHFHECHLECVCTSVE